MVDACWKTEDSCQAACELAFDDCACKASGYPGFDQDQGLCTEKPSAPGGTDPCSQRVTGLPRTPWDDYGTPAEMMCCRDAEDCEYSGGTDCAATLLACATKSS